MSVSRKVTVALFLGGGVFLFALGLFLIGDRRMLFERSFELRASYRNLAGLKVGSKVQVAGLDAGEILSISVPGGPEAPFEVRFRVLERFRAILRSDSVATIEMDGLVGNKVLQLGPGSGQGKPLEGGELIPSREPVQIGDVIREVVETVQEARDSIGDVRRTADAAIDGFAELTKNAFEMVNEIGGEAREITRAGRAIVGDVGQVVADVRAGRGSLGKLLTDDALYERVRGTVREVEATAVNLRETTDAAKAFTDEIKQANLAQKLDRTAENVQEITEKAKVLLAGLAPQREGDGGISADLRQTLANANRAMVGLNENMQALKRNWLFRGFFNQRGFFDLDAVAVADYQAGRFAAGRVQQRQWLHQFELFTVSAEGAEELTAEGRKKLDAAIAGFLRHARTNPLMIEGYASAGAPEEQFLRSFERASRVRRYLLQRFPLNPNYVGVMPMGAVPSSDPSGAPWDGVALVLFLPPEDGRRER